MAAVSLKNLSKVFDGHAAVDNICLDVADGEFMVIVGPCGCGKTTVLRLIAGLETLTNGTVEIDDRDVTGIATKDRDVAMVFQNYALYPHMTVFENIGFGLKMRRYPKEKIHQQVSEIAKTLDIEPLLSKKPSVLSGGQRQRVALGRAIVQRPKVFLFDEPLSNLDARLRVGMRTELKSLHQRLKTTTIYVTHDQSEAVELGERICVMNDGRIQQTAAPSQIHKNPANEFVADFFSLRRV